MNPHYITRRFSHGQLGIVVYLELSFDIIQRLPH
jgi:hypothetical protein